MKQALNFVFSMKFTIILLLIFAFSIGTATFIEEKFDTVTARILVYNSKWLEIIYLLLILNFLGNIKRYNLLRWGKVPGLVFHLAFIIVIAGAGVTRYFGYTGMMHIREGQLSDMIYSTDPFLQVELEGNSQHFSYEQQLYLSDFTRNSFKKKIRLPGREKVEISLKKFIKNGAGNAENNSREMDALFFEIKYKEEVRELTVLGGAEIIGGFQKVKLDDITLKIAYGSRKIKLPFSLYLDDFKLERYAGSMSPSSFESRVTLIDERDNLHEVHRVMMNKVLDYKKYRFFQSSYDEDENGTILSVNHDFYGTRISYLGYFLLGAGFLMTLLNKNSRFYSLRKKIQDLRKNRKGSGFTFFLFFVFSSSAFSQSPVQKPVSHEHAEKLGQLIVQTYDGRFEPLHTLAADLIQKISRQNEIISPQKGKMTSMQVFIDMIIDPEYWRQQKFIYVREKSVRDVLGINDKYASFNDFFTVQMKYKLTDPVESAFRKSLSEQSRFDKEIIKADERVNICYMMFEGSLIRIFPEQGSDENVWISPADTMAFIPLSGPVNIIKKELELETLNYNSLMHAYLNSLLISIKTGDYSKPDKILGFFEAIQRNSNSRELLPSRSKVKMEIWYNNSRIFIKLKNIYGILSIILLILAFTENLRSESSRLVRGLLYFFIFLLGLGFLYHTYGLVLRSYLSGHAPWSNGYEALLLIAWGGLLAGFIYVQYSRITLASTALLGFLILMTAGHSSYDPQLTNLQPVLKSYWLIIHVAVMTISYGFLGSGFILGNINLILYLFKSPSNNDKISRITKELTYINELNLTTGLVLATLGTFLGAIWANESWGRYWGWDAKETWALVIIICYAIILHLRLVPGLKSRFIFNAASVIGFGSVIMTFVGVNYYLSKGLHSYASGEMPVFPLWAWVMIISLILLVIAGALKEKKYEKHELPE